MTPRSLDPRALNQFWDRAKTDSASYALALRKELSDRDIAPLLLFDGSVRLLSLSNTASDRQFVLDAIARYDYQGLPREVGIMPYFTLVHNLAVENENTTWAAFRILAWPDVIVPIMPGLTLGQNFSLVTMLLPTNPNHWLKPVAERLSSEPDQTAQQSLLLLLWYAQDDFADQEIRAFAKNTQKPAASRKYAEGLAARRANLTPAELAEIRATPEASLRQRRREILKGFGIERLRDLENYTIKLIAKRQMSAVKSPVQ